ncbi:unnamed protein product [Rotaria socialis]|uniref:Heat shock factor-binding protein 1 n=1 Tax=Rotaria socialis TaxID=392032 RepID=A0A818DI78_9BILA|nr:unnamed protein product [Rotaria socialis]CAF3392480.1 unnamed protein product [Rotaria socialis]CAF3433142.1 unnamed protein product [Rotaria socialis]CAF3441138.1 unnamed protein product [Rotaria socialis]CAF3484210.1 unnamed protein product [Rotaria socialis]
MTNSATTPGLINMSEYPMREPQNAQELVNLVQNTISQIQDKFGQMSDTIMTRIDDMGRRIDDLERNIAHVIAQTNAELS